MLKQLLIIIGLSFFASCVPNKDLVYLQGVRDVKKDIFKVNNKPYRLQVDDVLSISIKAKDEKSVALFQKVATSEANASQTREVNLQNGYSIDAHGNIRLPYIGEVNVLGYTTKEVRLKLEKALLQYLKNEDDIFVTVMLSGIKFTIFGEVGSPGTKVIKQNNVSIIEAIANSGDITVTGNRKKIVVWRTTPGGRKKYNIDLTRVDAFDSEIYYIQPNDLIYVLPIRQKAWGTGTTGLQSLSTIISVFTLVTSTILIIRNF